MPLFVRVPLSSGNGFALVDEADHALVASRRWCLSNSGYATRDNVFMHRLILSADRGQYVDHINGDKLDNRRANLRLCTLSQNSANRRPARRSTSGYRGVSRTRAGKWRAELVFHGEWQYLGLHETKEQAARAYNAAALARWGEFARLNVVREVEI